MYRVCILRRAIKDMVGLPKEYASLVGKHIDRLQENPRPTGSKKLRGEAGYRLRVGVYRVLYSIDDGNRVVTVYRVKHRREAYR
jgi:mRNA interferase RelE/StbE